MGERYDDDYENNYDDDHPTPQEFMEAVENVRAWRARRDREEAAEPSLEEFFTKWWPDDSVVVGFREALESANEERDMQVFLEANPSMLILPLGGGHGRWVIPHKRLGSEYVTDFMVAEKNSLGFGWTAVELESPLAQLFQQSGDLTSTLTHAIRQITDWRDWLTKNLDYAMRPRDKKGLGLVDIDPQLPGWIILGRRAQLDPEAIERRRTLGRQLRIEIHTYDWLLEIAEASAARRRSES